jgi:hypothetical protein
MTSHNKIRYRVEHKPVLKNNKQTEIISTFWKLILKKNVKKSI